MTVNKITSRRTSKVMILLIQSILLLQIFVPLASAAGMTTCSDLGGTCDDYNSSQDQSPDHPDWVNGAYDFKLLDTSNIQLNLTWAIHEFDRSALGFDSLDSALAADGLGPNDGAPADLIRNYFDATPAGPGTNTVGVELRKEVNTALESSLESGIGNVSDIDTDYVSSITQGGVTTACSTDPSTDSVYSSEGASENNAFMPPICISSTVVIELTESAFSLNSSSSFDLERTYQGLLVMGAEITTDFSLLTLPGHQGNYSFSPPDYADIMGVDENGTIAGRAGTPGNSAYFAGEWGIDHRNAPVGASDLETPISVVIANRDRPSTSTVSIDNSSKAIDLNIKLDLTDESAATLDFVVEMAYLDESILNEWDISLVSVTDKATLPVITSDGIRLAYHNGLVDLTEFTSQFPVESIADGISSTVGGIEEIEMNEMYWVSDALSDGLSSAGGLNYTHSTGCTETPSPGVELNYCVRGPSAMTEEYPVFLRTTSQPFSMRLIDILKENNGDENIAKFLDVITENDFRSVLNSGLSIETALSSDYLEEIIPDNLPPSELTLEIILPTWVRTIDGQNKITMTHSLDNNSDSEISFAGTNPYDWRNEIKNSDGEVVCTTLQRTCISTSIDFDISEFRINEWTQSVSVDFALDAELSIHRITVPLDRLEQSGTTQVHMEALPSDLIRLGLDIASRMSEPQVIEGPESICNDDQDMEVCDEDLSFSFTEQGLTDFSKNVGEVLTAYIQQIGKELPEQEDSPLTNVDLSGFEIKTAVKGIGAPDLTIGDDEPITLSVEIPMVEFKLDIDGNLGEMIGGEMDSLEVSFFANAMSNQILRPMVDVAEAMGASLSNGLVSGQGVTFPDPEQSELSYTFSGNTSVNEEFEAELSGPISITLPKGITLKDAKSTSGNLEVKEKDGRQVVTYTIPNGEFEDTITFRVEVSWGYILTQFWVYPTIIISLLFLMIRRRRRKKRLKKQRAVVKSSQASKVGIGDSEFSDLQGFHSGGLHGDLEQFKDYSNASKSSTEIGDEFFD
tara:strand:+ start:2861 stop:5935 length:3075 start_codon:yes stop_codon:yes gene_type:complete